MLNQSSEVFSELQLQDVYQTFNGLELKELDYTRSKGTKWIGSIEATPSMWKYLEDRRLFETNKIMNEDHR